MYYVIMKQGNVEIPNNETVYMSSKEDSGFTNNILEADKYAGRKAALIVKHDYDMKRNSIHESDVKLVPMKVTYEW